MCCKRYSACLQVYGDAAAVYAALDQRLQSERGGMFFFGSKPSSLDALLFSHLSYHLGAPSSAPELRQSVGSPVPVPCLHLVHSFHSPQTDGLANLYPWCSRPTAQRRGFIATFRVDSKSALSDLSACVAAFGEEGVDSICRAHQSERLLLATSQGAYNHNGRVGTTGRGGNCTIIYKVMARGRISVHPAEICNDDNHCMTVFCAMAYIDTWGAWNL